MPRQRHHDFADAVLTSVATVGVLFLVTAAQTVLHLQLVRWGIVPRTASGLIGVVFGPLLHANLQHVMANAIPLFALLILLQSDPRYRPVRTLMLIWIASGLGTWLIGRGHTVHVGASSIVFGLAAFLIVAGIVMKSWRSALVAVFVTAMFGGIFYGVLPQQGAVSWEGHLSGALAGAWTAVRTLNPRGASRFGG